MVITKAMANLIKVNLEGYFGFRKDGVGHEDALMKLVKSRYLFFEHGKRDKVLTLWSEARASKLGINKTTSPSEKDELRDLLRYMYIVETRLDKVDMLTLEAYSLKFDAKFNELFEREGGSNQMSEKVTIASKYIGDFVEWLGLSTYHEYGGKAKDKPWEKMNQREQAEVRQWVNIVGLAISKGFILAKYQPELADALIQFMNASHPGLASKLLNDMLAEYRPFVYMQSTEGGWRPSGAPK